MILICALNHRNLELSAFANFKPKEEYLTYLYINTHISLDTTFYAAFNFFFVKSTRMLFFDSSEDMVSDDSFRIGEAPKLASFIGNTDCSGLPATTRSIRLDFLQKDVMDQTRAKGI